MGGFHSPFYVKWLICSSHEIYISYHGRETSLYLVSVRRSDEPQTIEDILKEKGETVVKGTVEDATKADQAVVAAAIADAVGKKEAIELREGEVGRSRNFS